MAVMKLSPENYKMYYVSPEEGKVKVRLYDHEGNMIYAKKVKHEDATAYLIASLKSTPTTKK